MEVYGLNYDHKKYYTFYFDFSVNFKNYHCVQIDARRPFDIIAAWKITKLKMKT